MLTNRPLKSAENRRGTRGEGSLIQVRSRSQTSNSWAMQRSIKRRQTGSAMASERPAAQAAAFTLGHHVLDPRLVAHAPRFGLMRRRRPYSPAARPGG